MTGGRRTRRQQARTRRIVVGVVLVVTVAVIVVLAIRPGWWVRLDHPVRYPTYVRTHAKNYSLPPTLIAAVAQRESGFDHEARSEAGAVGVMQLTPDTARGIAERTGGRRFRQDDLLDPEISIRYGAFYLRLLHRKYDRRPGGDDDYRLTLAAYNAGQGRVDGWLEDEAGEDGELAINEIPFDETRAYVREVQRLRDDYARSYPSLRRPDGDS